MRDAGALAEAFRSGATTMAAAAPAQLDRIARLDPRIGAYEHVAAGRATAAAGALDALRAAGTDLGPLMGVPVAVKDLLAVDGMPVTAGSNLDVREVIGGEGPFVRKLKRAGAVILGKVRTVEFAMGGSGVSSARGTPWNPHDLMAHRTPGGSSSGSSAAVAAGLAPLAIGSDTGGSVRVPAAYAGVVGLKTTHGHWPLDGVFPLSPSLDTIGLLTRSVADAALTFAALDDVPAPRPRPVRGMRLGRPGRFFEGDLEPAVAEAFRDACRALERAGAVFVDIELPEAHRLDTLFRGVNAADFLGTFGVERFEAGRAVIGPEIVARMERGLGITAAAYQQLRNPQDRLADAVAAAMEPVDAWIAPTTPMTAPRLTDYGEDGKLELDSSRFTRQANFYRLCALSIPIPRPAGALPVGLQVACTGGADLRLLGLGLGIEQVLGRARLPELP